ncbi:MAG: peptidoglycan recognition family protein [Phycisphaerales bacterium]
MNHQDPNPASISISDHDLSVQSDGVSRRRAVGLVARAGTIAVALGAITTLTGCGSAAQRRVKSRGGSVGDPIPSDPLLRTAGPSPVYTSSPMPDIATNLPLSSIPSFVIPRGKWTSSEPRRWLADPMHRISRITVHHDAIMPAPSGSYADSLRRMQLIRTGHLNNGWADIGYHFAIDPSGRVWQARPLELQGAHVKDHNPGNLGIVVFGNYEQMRPTGASLDAVNRMLAYAMDRFNIPMSQVRTHQELRPTACPGRFLQQQMNQTRASGGRLAQMVGSRTIDHG